MADAPIGISFIPSAQNQPAGPANLSADGGIGRGSTDLAQAYKILSLRLPTTVAPTAPVQPTLLNSAGSAGVTDLPGGLTPYAALFMAMLKSHLGVGDAGSSPAAAPSAGSPGSFSAPDVLSGLLGTGGGSGTTEGGPVPPGRAIPPPKIQFPTEAPTAPTPTPDTTSFDRPSTDYGGYF